MVPQKLQMLEVLQLHQDNFCNIYNDWQMLRCDGGVAGFASRRVCRRQTPTAHLIHILMDKGVEWVTFWKNIL